jgi:dihydroneopterin aldolase
MEIVLRDIHFTAPLDVDSWGRASKPTQPILHSLAVTVPPPTAPSAETDEVAVDYSKLAALVLECAHSPAAAEQSHKSSSLRYWTALDFHQCLGEAIAEKWPSVTKIKLGTTLPIGLHGVGASAVWESIITPFLHSRPRNTASLLLRDIRATTLIGLRPHEETAKQTVLTSLKFTLSDESFKPGGELLSPGWPHKFVTKIVQTVEASTNKTVEGLALDMSKSLLSMVKKFRQTHLGFDEDIKDPMLYLTWLRVVKTDALQFVDGAGVEMEFK